jgi:hypothetical protein
MAVRTSRSGLSGFGVRAICFCTIWLSAFSKENPTLFWVGAILIKYTQNSVDMIVDAFFLALRTTALCPSIEFKPEDLVTDTCRCWGSCVFVILKIHRRHDSCCVMPKKSADMGDRRVTLADVGLFRNRQSARFTMLRNTPSAPFWFSLCSFATPHFPKNGRSVAFGDSAIFSGGNPPALGIDLLKTP